MVEFIKILPPYNKHYCLPYLCLKEIVLKTKI